jgi:hypothetical protein
VRKSKLILMGGVSASLLVALSLVVVAASSAASPKAAISPAAAKSMAAGATSPVIVVLKNQVSSTPATPALVSARKAKVQQAQSPVLQTLTQSGAQDVHSYTVLDAVSATVPTADVSALKANPAVSAVVPNTTIPLPNPPASAPSSGSAATPVSPAPGVCAPPGKVQLDPQALEAIQTARSLGITGAGVKVGVHRRRPRHQRPRLHPARRPARVRRLQGLQRRGHVGAPTGGEEAFLDASSIAAQGREVYNISNYSDLPLNRPCYIRIEGVAPGASLVGLDIFGAEDAGFNSSFLQAIDYAVTVDHVNVLNESLGNNYYPDDQASLDLIKQANDAAVAAGTTVTVSRAATPA